jgi:ketosteroid isomerase-like protein
MFDKHLIHKYFEMLNHRNTKEMEDLINSDTEFYFPKTQPLIGKKRIMKFLNILFRQYPELTFKIQRVIQQDDKAAVHWTNQGMNRRKEPYQNEGVTILEMQDGKIRFISDFFKDTEIL